MASAAGAGRSARSAGPPRAPDLAAATDGRVEALPLTGAAGRRMEAMATVPAIGGAGPGGIAARATPLASDARCWRRRRTAGLGGAVAVGLCRLTLLVCAASECGDDHEQPPPRMRSRHDQSIATVAPGPPPHCAAQAEWIGNSRRVSVTAAQSAPQRRERGPRDPRAGQGGWRRGKARSLPRRRRCESRCGYAGRWPPTGHRFVVPCPR